VAEEQLGDETCPQRFAGQSLVAELEREPGGEIGVLESLAEPLVEPPQTGAHALVRHSENLAIVFGLLRGLEKQRYGLVESVVGPDAGEPHKSSCATPSCGELLDHGTELRLCSRRVPGLVVQVRGVDEATERVCAPVGRGQLARPVEQERGRPRCATCTCALRGVLERERNLLVRLRHRRRQLPRRRLRILEELGKPRVDGFAAIGIRRFVGPRS
jgi:hypothetical protein